MKPSRTKRSPQVQKQMDYQSSCDNETKKTTTENKNQETFYLETKTISSGVIPNSMEKNSTTTKLCGILFHFASAEKSFACNPTGGKTKVPFFHMKKTPWLSGNPAPEHCQNLTFSLGSPAPKLPRNLKLRWDPIAFSARQKTMHFHQNFETKAPGMTGLQFWFEGPQISAEQRRFNVGGREVDTKKVLVLPWNQELRSRQKTFCAILVLGSIPWRYYSTFQETSSCHRSTWIKVTSWSGFHYLECDPICIYKFVPLTPKPWTMKVPFESVLRVSHKLYNTI